MRWQGIERGENHKGENKERWESLGREQGEVGITWEGTGRGKNHMGRNRER
jgi:hypothetical protein